MNGRLDHLNAGRKKKSLDIQNDFGRALAYYCSMKPAYDWYLAEWLSALHKKQADIVRDLDWNKARVSLMLSGKQQYTRDAVNELSLYLNIRPYELLMHPDDAMRLRRLKEDAIRIAHDATSIEPDDGMKFVSIG